MQKFETVDDIIMAAGGAPKLAAAIGCHRSTPNVWREAGIPEKHWSAIQRVVPDLCTAELHDINRRLREQRAEIARILDASHEEKGM